MPQVVELDLGVLLLDASLAGVVAAARRTLAFAFSVLSAHPLDALAAPAHASCDSHLPRTRAEVLLLVDSDEARLRASGQCR